MFDYEWATVQHNVNCRLAAAVVVPDAIPPERLDRYGARGSCRPYEGLKEEYYLADFEPDEAVLDELGLDREPPDHRRPHAAGRLALPPLPQRPVRRSSSSACARPPPARACSRSCCRGSHSQRRELGGVPGFVVPEHAIDAQSLIAFADLVISAGGTMNREAVALGTPVYTTFSGRMGAVDERLIAEGRMGRLAGRSGSASGARRGASRGPPRVRRDPRRLLELLLSPLAARHRRASRP